MKYFLYSINHTLPVLGGYGDLLKGHQIGKTKAIIYSHAICKPETTFKKMLVTWDHMGAKIHSFLNTFLQKIKKSVGEIQFY